MAWAIALLDSTPCCVVTSFDRENGDDCGSSEGRESDEIKMKNGLDKVRKMTTR